MMLLGRMPSMPKNGNIVYLEQLTEKNGKWYLGQWPVEDGMTIERCQCMQSTIKTICSGIKNLKFIECNLTNAEVPIDANVVRSLRIEKSFCSHLNPHMKDLPKCPKECIHADSYTPSVEVDGQIIADEIYVRSNKLLTRTPGSTGIKVQEKTIEDLENEATIIFGKPIKATAAVVDELKRID